MRRFILVLGALLASAITAQADVFDTGGTRNPTTGTWTGLASHSAVPVAFVHGERGTKGSLILTGDSR